MSRPSTKRLPHPSVISPLQLLCFISLLVLLFGLAACAQNQLVDNGTTTVTPPAANGSDQVRPDIPHTEPPATRPVPSEGLNPNGPIIRQFLNTTLFVRQAPGGIVAGDALHPFLFGKTIADVLPLLTRHQLTTLAGPQPSIAGQTLRADDYVRFDFGNESSGELQYVRDPVTGVMGSELFFAEDAPMFEYAYLLQDGSFPALIGQQLSFFGHTYVVKDATNTSIELYGQNIQQYLTLANGSVLYVDGVGFAHTHVQVDPWSVMIRYLAPAPDGDGVRIGPGQTLREKLKNDSILLNPLFDIAYDGLDQSPNDTVTLRAGKNGAYIDFRDASGTPVTLPFASTTGWGERGYPLHVKECASASDYCIAVNDEFLVTTRSGLTHVFELDGASTLGDTLQLRDVATNQQYVVLPVDTHQTVGNSSVLDGTLDLDGSAVRIAILLNESPARSMTRISVDQDDDGSIDGADVPLVLNHYHEILFPDENQTNASRWIELRSLALPGADEELLPVTITLGTATSFSVGNVTLGQVNGTDSYEGMSERGVLATLHSTDGGLTGDELTLAYPLDYRAGLVRIIG